jgi:sugar lactone lactonase YvrE
MKTHTCTTLVDNTQGLMFTESPRWHGGKLWFLDNFQQRIKTLDMQGNVEVAVQLPFTPNGWGHKSDGSLLIGDAFKRTMHRWDGKNLELVADLSSMLNFCFSDAVVDAKDRMYIGDIGFNVLDHTAKPVNTCRLVCVNPDGSARIVAEGLTFPNGIVISPDGKTLIVAETYAPCLTAFDVAEDGSLSSRRVFAPLASDIHPDGIALDAEGAVWIANPQNSQAHATVLRIREGGEILEAVELNSFACAVMLGGPERRHLFISAQDSLNPKVLSDSPSATIRVVEVAVPGVGLP